MFQFHFLSGKACLQIRRWWWVEIRTWSGDCFYVLFICYLISSSQRLLISRGELTISLTWAIFSPTSVMKVSLRRVKVQSSFDLILDYNPSTVFFQRGKSWTLNFARLFLMWMRYDTIPHKFISDSNWNVSTQKNLQHFLLTSDILFWTRYWPEFPKLIFISPHRLWTPKSFRYLNLFLWIICIVPPLRMEWWFLEWPKDISTSISLKCSTPLCLAHPTNS